MRAALQSGGRSRKRLLNGPSASQQLKTASDGTQNGGLSKGRKRERNEQGVNPAKQVNLDDIKSEIAKITEKGGLPNVEAVEKLVDLMLDRTEQKIDLSDRVILADVIAATESPDCLGRFVQSRGLLMLDSWLQEAHKGKSGDGSSPKEAEKPIDELLLALLRAAAKLPINLTALQNCSIGKSVNHLRIHKNLEIKKKATCLVEIWKKRIDAEMKSTDVKHVVSGQSVYWSGKAGFQEISNAGTKRGGSSENSPKNPVPTLSSSKVSTDKPGGTDAAAKLSPVVSASSNLQHVQPANVTTNLKDQTCKSTGGAGPELPTVKEEKSSSSSQSPNNSQSISSEPSKDARSSTAASGGASKTSGSSSRSHRRANNGLVSGNLKEASAGRSVYLDRPLLQDKSSPTGTASGKGVDMPSDYGNSHRLVVRFPNPGRSPARSASAGSFDDPSVTGGRASSPVDLIPYPPSLIHCSQWEKGECIGTGSFGQVYRGFNSEHKQFCAIKEVQVIFNDPRSKEQLKQLNQEIYFLKQFPHPNIVQYYGSIMTDTTLSIFMEYVSKGSIHVLLAKYGPFKEPMIRRYTSQILSGLAFLHERRHIHRDIKGANILVGPNNEVKLADFGLAKHISTLTEVHTSNRGTPCWMAPEVILSNHSGKGYNLSADIWSLGCTIVEMATGKPPLHGYEPIQAIFKIANDTYIPEIPDVLSDEGKNFLQLCLQRDPASRPSAAQLMDHQFIRNQGS